MRATCPTHLIFLDIITRIILLRCANHEVPRYAVFSSLLLLPLRHICLTQHSILESPYPTLLP
jgi:hypothetical protein